jgi:aminomethyltransferase
MMCRREDGLLVIVNASCKEADTRHLFTHIGHRCQIVPMPDRALLALQGPAAAAVMARLAPAFAQPTFMGGAAATIAGVACFATRSGYTGEDGFEISVAAEQADALARKLLAQPEVVPCGLGARDTLRLEAGLCLYGHDIDTTTTPIEAALAWAIQKVRRPGGARAGGYPGAATIERQLASGPEKKRVGLVGLERVPVREAAAIVDDAGVTIGRVTSGTIGPTVGKPIALAYVPTPLATVGTALDAEVRGKRQPMQVTGLPFTPHRYFRG